MYFYQSSLFLDMGLFPIAKSKSDGKSSCPAKERHCGISCFNLGWWKTREVTVFLLVWWWWQYFPSIIFECSVCALSKIICQILQFIQTQKLVPMILIRSGPHAICCPEKQTEVNASFAFENGWMGSCRFYHHLRQSRKTIYSSSTFLGSPAA